MMEKKKKKMKMICGMMELMSEVENVMEKIEEMKGKLK